MTYEETDESQIIRLSLDDGDTWCECEVPVYRYYCNKRAQLNTDSKQKVQLHKTKTIANHDYPWYYRPCF